MPCRVRFMPPGYNSAVKRRTVVLTTAAGILAGVACSTRAAQDSVPRPPHDAVREAVLRTHLQADRSSGRYCWLVEGRSPSAHLRSRLDAFSSRLVALSGERDARGQFCRAVLDVRILNPTHESDIEVEIRQLRRMPRDDDWAASGDIYRTLFTDGEWHIDDVVEHWVR